MYYCGWDGGGSKTAVCITDANGNILAQRSFGAINPNGTTQETVMQTVFDCVACMRAQPEGLQGCKGLVIGMAGISNPTSAHVIKNALQKAGYTGNLHLTGDTEIALAGAVQGAGAVLIAGTGSVCFGRDARGNKYRCGGWGHILDDRGGGYAIGKEILIAVMKATDGRACETALTDAVFRHLHVTDLQGMIAWLYAPETDKKQVAALAPLLLPALAQEDAAALQIAKQAAQDLAELAIALWKKAGLQKGELALRGSIFTHFDCIREQTVNILTDALPSMCIVQPLHTPAYGAAKTAKLLFE